MTLHEGAVTRGSGLHHGHGVRRDAVAVGGHRGRVDQDGAGEGQVAAGQPRVQREVPGARHLTSVTSVTTVTRIIHRGLRLMRRLDRA